MVENDTIIQLFDSIGYNSARTHIITKCPFCDKPEHLYIQQKTDKVDKYNKNASFSFQCKKCGENGRIFKLLKKLDALHLIQFKAPVENNWKLSKIDFEKYDNYKYVEPDEVDSIFGYQKVLHHPYLENRKFTEYFYNYFAVGQSTLLQAHKDRLVYSIFNNQRCVAWISRSIYTKLQIQQINELRIAKGEKKYLRYINSHNTDFARILVGLDEINNSTKTIIAVEGLFDKVSIDSALNLMNSKGDIVCVACNTKSLSIDQQYLIRQKASNLQRLIIWFDPDAVTSIKEQSFKLFFDFPNVSICYDEFSDPGELDNEDIINIFKNNIRDVFSFKLDILNKRKLQI